MAGETDQQPSQADATPVPDLIERYRLRRDAWIAQADELARLRDEVRGSAEREALEIVTAARRDVRKVIMEARRELLVLSAQVQAALGEATAKTDPATLLDKAGISTDPGRPVLTAGEVPSAAEEAVNEILNEVHQDMASLAEDARALPLQIVPPLKPIEDAPPAPALLDVPQPRTPTATTVTPHPWVPPPRASTPVQPQAPAIDTLGLTDAASTTLLSSPFPSKAVPVEADRRVSAFVAVFVAIGVVVAGATVWWFSNRNSGSSQTTAAISKRPAEPPAATPPTVPRPADAATSSTPGAAAGNLSLVAEAVRDVWVRTTIDGRPDLGRTLMTGQVIDVSAEQSISLRVGDAGAIVVSVNHGEKRPLGRDGQIVTRQFVVEGATAPPKADPAPVPSPPPPPAPANRSAAPPIALAAPAAIPPAPPPKPALAPATSPAPNAPPSAAPPSAAPTPAVPTSPANQLVANGAQPAIPSVSQLSAPAPALPTPAPAAPGGSPATLVVAAARQWLDAYHRQDRATMAALSTDNLLLADERRTDERFAPGATDVTRTLDRVSVQIAADTAVLTAVMIEQSGSASSHVSPISQVWVLGSGQWKVRQARFVSEARLNQAFTK